MMKMLLTSTCINDLGLMLDIIGAILLFKFGLPASINRDGHIGLAAERTDHAAIAKGKLYDRWGKIGLFLLVVGFGLQLASNHIGN